MRNSMGERLKWFELFAAGLHFNKDPAGSALTVQRAHRLLLSIGIDVETGPVVQEVLLHCNQDRRSRQIWIGRSVGFRSASAVPQSFDEQFVPDIGGLPAF
jgi:hypothetical protein